MKAMKLYAQQNLVSPAVVEILALIFADYQIPSGSLYLDVSAIGSNDAAADTLQERMDGPLAIALGQYCRNLCALATDLSMSPVRRLEVWTRTAARHDDKVLLHVDNDEALREASGAVHCPVFGSVLHLATCGSSIEGGGTFFVTSNEVSVAPYLFQPTSWQLLEPVLLPFGFIASFIAGQTILFDGKMPHCIMPFTVSDPTKPRISLLVNGWG
jgi:hypothetical protein